MFQFYLPWFALLLPLPFLIRSLPKKEGALLHFPGLKRLRNCQKSSLPLKNRNLFLALAWVCLILALMQPERVEQLRKVTNKGYDLLLAVDISGSMQALDFSTATKKINRLDVVKEVVGKFVLGRVGDRVGLITFGENAYLHVPLTLDTASLSHMLNDTVTGMAGNGTAIGDAIGMGVRILRERKEGSRVLVLLTDGEDNSSRIPPIEAAKLAKQYGIRIYTIGVGKKGPVPFPTGFGYGMAEIPMDEELLKQISTLTGGQFYLATDKKTLESIYREINTLEKTDAEQSLYLLREPLYFYPLSFAMLFLFLPFLIRRFRYGI